MIKRNKKGQFVKGSTYRMNLEHKKKIGLANKGLKRTEETKKKISKSKKGQNSGEEHYNWKGGRCYSSDGYILVLRSDHPHANKDGYVFEHRLIMESFVLGRYLTPKEIVHHINHKPDDNRVENLMLMNRAEHNTIHHKGNSESKKKGWITRRKKKPTVS